MVITTFGLSGRTASSQLRVIIIKTDAPIENEKKRQGQPFLGKRPTKGRYALIKADDSAKYNLD
jgi:hypothetical protein